MKQRLHQYAYHMIGLLFILIGLIPEKRADRLARAISAFWYRIDKRHRNVALTNLTHAFGEEKSAEEIDTLARDTFYHTVLTLFEMGQSTHWAKETVKDRFRYYGMHHAYKAHAKGKGVLFVMAHMGNWEFLAPAIVASGLQPAAVYRPLDFAPMDAYIKDMREKFGCRMYPTKRAIEGILHELGQGNVVGLLVDQNATKRRQGVFVDFFGRKASAHKGIAQLALTTGVPVVSFFVVRENGKFRAEFGPEIPVVNTGDLEADLVTNTQNFNRVIERIVRRFPAQWFWVHRRWKTRPLDEVDG
ncbi:MAG: lysophospholipid acyltransferase family protein [Desulfobacterales bacterium]|nr:lysophospholipid acyltransferase family protein [Desulfobacterales bacterium]